jgi:thiamine pyrophosphokinase
MESGEGDMVEKENKILVITGGRIEDQFLSDLIKKEQYSMIIAADSGLAAADRLNLTLDFIVGDFDSVPEKVLAKYRETSTPTLTFPTEKDKTDTQIALELALMHSPSCIDIAGGMGTRLDHTMANVHLLLLPMQLGISACLIDSKNRISLQSHNFSIRKAEQYGQFVSLLPFTEKVSGLTLTGFKYPLDHITLSSGSSLGISNEIVEETALVELTEGILLVFESRD